MTLKKRTIYKIRAIAQEWETGTIRIFEMDSIGFNNFMVNQTDYEILDIKKFNKRG